MSWEYLTIYGPCYLGRKRRWLCLLTVTCSLLLQGSGNLCNFKPYLQETTLKIAVLDDQTKFADIRSYSIHTKISIKNIYKFYCKSVLTSFMIMKVKKPCFSLNPILQFIIKDIKMKSLTITTNYYKINQDKVKSLAWMQPMEKKNTLVVLKH